MRTTTAAVSPVVTAGRLIFVTNTGLLPGGGRAAADALCEASKPAGAGPVRALLAGTAVAAAAVLDPTAAYVRPDGQAVGTGADLAGSSILSSGVWQRGNGAYATVLERVFTGALTLNLTGTSAETCSDWTATTGTAARVGVATTAGFEWWKYANDSCAQPRPIYCVEQ
jgi:hypothetical protein